MVDGYDPTTIILVTQKIHCQTVSTKDYKVFVLQDGERNWKNLLLWLQSFYEGNCGGRVDRGPAVRRTAEDCLIVGIFRQLDMRLLSNNSLLKSWEGLRPHFEQMRPSLAASDPAWDQD